MKMKKIVALLLVVAMLLGMTACSGGEENTGGETQEAEGVQEEVKLVTNGRLSAMEAPEGWKQKEANADNVLVYIYVGEGDPEDDMLPRLWIDIDEFETPEEKVERAKEDNADIGKECETEDVTIDGIDFIYLIPSFGYNTLYGTKDDVTIMISHDKEIELENEAVQAFVKSIQVRPEEE